MRQLAIGCMRLSTAPTRDDDHAIAVLHAALDAGVRLLDTADVYANDDADCGHNERLVARALGSWSGDASSVRVATKGGLTRPRGAWVPDGRATHLARACEASLVALGRPRIDLYQLHAPDPRTPLRTSVRALARLVRDGIVAEVGLCNVTVQQIEAARAEVEIAAVQIELSPLHDTALRGGVVEYCLAHGIAVLAHRPLGGAAAAAKLGRHRGIAAIAAKHGRSAADIVLAWLRSLAPSIVPLPGPTRIDTARACGAIDTLELDEGDRDAIERAFPAADLLRRPRAVRRGTPRDDGEVVILMGIPGAGKSTRAQALVDRGYARLNRDTERCTLAKLASRLDALLDAGTRRVVLDNTYPLRSDRNLVIETAWRHGVAARCVWLDTSIEDARINAIGRMLAAHGRLLEPAELARRDAVHVDTIPPRAQLDYLRALEPPTEDEGFEAIERAHFERRSVETGPVICVVDVDRVVPTHAAAIRRTHAAGATIVGWAWRPTPAVPRADEEAELCDALGVPITLRTCTHPAGPPTCWCRPPLPGLVLAAIHDHAGSPTRTHLLGVDAAGQRFAAAAGVRYVDAREA